MTVPNTKFHVNPSRGSRTDICRRMDISKQMRVATMRACAIMYNVVGCCYSVVSTAARLGAGRTGARIPAGSSNFSLLYNAQTGCGVHPAFYSVGVVVLSWRQRGVGMRLIAHLYLMTRLRMTGAGLQGVGWDNFTFNTWSDHSEWLRRKADDQTTVRDYEDTDDQTTARDWEDKHMIRLQRGTEKTSRWSDYSEGLRRHADDQTTARDWEDTQMIRRQRGSEKTRRWSDYSERLRRQADDQTTARDSEDTPMIRTQRGIEKTCRWSDYSNSLATAHTDFLTYVHRPMETRTAPSFQNLS